MSHGLINSIHISLASCGPFPSSLPLLFHLLTHPQGERTGHILDHFVFKKNGHQPVNNACTVPACVTVGRVLSGSIGESAGKMRVVNE